MSAIGISPRSTAAGTAPVQSDTRAPEPGLRVLQRRRAMDNLFIAAMVVLWSVFAFEMVKYVLAPAARTATSATAHSPAAGRR
jgi:hypothetical protein